MYICVVLWIDIFTSVEAVYLHIHFATGTAYHRYTCEYSLAGNMYICVVLWIDIFICLCDGMCVCACVCICVGVYVTMCVCKQEKAEALPYPWSKCFPTAASWNGLRTENRKWKR